MSIFSLEVIFLSMMKLYVFKDQNVVGYIGLSCESKKIWSFCGVGVGVVSQVQRHQDLQREREED